MSTTGDDADSPNRGPSGLVSAPAGSGESELARTESESDPIDPLDQFAEGIDLTADFRAQGCSWSELDDQGEVVIRE